MIPDPIRKNVWTVLGLLFAMTLAGCQYFWQPKGPSPSNPKEWVTRAQLEAEVIAFDAKVRASYSAIELQEAGVQKVLSALSGIVSTVPSPWVGVATLGLGALGLGLGVDNRRKDGLVTGLKMAAKASGTQPEPPKEG